MEGFPTPAQARKWEGDTPSPPSDGNGRNRETIEKTPDTYSDNAVSCRGNRKESSETVYELTPEQVGDYESLKGLGFSEEEAQDMARKGGACIEI
jgi:hypothetical protein